MLQINSISIKIEYVDSETGEVSVEERVLGQETKKKKRTSKKATLDESDPRPLITLIEGKYQFNKAAIDLTGFEPDMKIDIQFEKHDKTLELVMFVDDKTGNRLTKTYTVSCKGARRDNLLEYGDVFELFAIDDRPGVFLLKGDKPVKQVEIIEVPESVDEEDITADVDEFFNDLTI